MTIDIRALRHCGQLMLGVALATAVPGAWAQEEFGELKVLIETNATDGDIGFHFLMDGDELTVAKIRDPNWRTIYRETARNALGEQTFTETFVESAEPLCFRDPEEPDEDFVTLAEFLERFAAGYYWFAARNADDEPVRGMAELTYNIPAAPADVDFDGSMISWTGGDDLGECEFMDLVSDNVIPDPADVPVVAWEVVMEPEDEALASRVFRVLLPGGAPSAVTVPAEYLASFDPETEFKIEVGAVEASANQTFSEEDGFCNTDDGACPNGD